MSKIQTKLVYLDENGAQHYSRESAVRANIKMKDDYVGYAVERKVQEILESVPITYKSPITTHDVARYMIGTDLIKAHKKILSLVKDAEKEFMKDYPKIVLK